MAEAKNVRIDEKIYLKLKGLSESSGLSVIQLTNNLISEVILAVEGKQPPAMLPTIKTLRDKLGKKSGLSPEIKAEVIALLKEIAEEK